MLVHKIQRRILKYTMLIKLNNKENELLITDTKEYLIKSC